MACFKNFNIYVAVLLLKFVLLFQANLAANEFCGALLEKHLASLGVVTEENEFPWITNIIYDKKNATQSICQGVLVNKRNVLLPNQCLLPGVVNDIQAVRVGASNLLDSESNAQIYEVEEIIINPSFNRYLYTSDIALLRLAKDVQYNPFVQPICIPDVPVTTKAKYSDYVGKFFIVAGFPYIGRGSSTDPVKYKMTFYVLSREYCLKLYPGIILNDDRICGVQSEGIALLPGAPIMALRIENGKPRNFFLIGMVSGVIGKDIHEQRYGDLIVIQTLSKNDFNWIKSNLD